MKQQTGQTAGSTSPATQISQQVDAIVTSAIDAARAEASAQAAGSTPNASTASSAETSAEPGTIVIGGDGVRPRTVLKVDAGGIHLQQGSAVATIPVRDLVSREAVQVSWAFAAGIGFLCIGLPIARAIARFIDRRSTALARDTSLHRQFDSRFETLERNLDTVAIEIERLSEAQRFASLVRPNPSANVAMPVAVPEAVPVPGREPGQEPSPIPSR